MSASFTPGPWNSQKGLHGNSGEFTIWAPFAPVPGNHQMIARLGNPHGADKDNARLIAAAPNLLKALEYIAKQWPDSFAARHARAAIATARVSTPTT